MKFETFGSQSADRTPESDDASHYEEQLDAANDNIAASPEKIAELREAREAFDADVASLETFQQLIWRVREEMYWRTKDRVDNRVSDLDPQNTEEYTRMRQLVEEYKQHAPLLVNDRRVVDLGTLEAELQAVEAGVDDVEQEHAIREIPALHRRVMELRSNRAKLRSVYDEERPYRIIPKGDFIPVHAIDRDTVAEVREISDPTPVVVAAGFSVSPRASRWDLIGFSELGRPAMTYDTDPHLKDFDPTLPFPPNTPKLTKIRTSALIRALEAGREDIYDAETKYDLVAYSQGSIDTLHAAIARPELFRNIILLNPPLVNQDKGYVSRMLALRERGALHKKQVAEQVAGKDIRHSAFHKVFSKDMEEVAARGGFPFLFESGSAIARAQLIPLIKEAREKGLNIMVLTGTEDPLFPQLGPQGVQANAHRAGVRSIGILGGHANVGFDPGAVSSWCTEVFEHMNEMAAEQQEESGEQEAA